MSPSYIWQEFTETRNGFRIEVGLLVLIKYLYAHKLPDLYRKIEMNISKMWSDEIGNYTFSSE